MKRQNEIEYIHKLHVQRKNWTPHNENALCWVLFCVNKNRDVNGANVQVM
jgi:hypothetical protein